MDNFYNVKLAPQNTINTNEFSTTLWGINFRLPLLNAAGMFKDGQGYDVVSSLGAGGYIGGTSTSGVRDGNIIHGIRHPFISLHQSNIAVNYLGLPNLGDALLHTKTITSQKISGCPIGWSLMRDPLLTEKEGVTELINSLFLYEQNPHIDFIEINESCPNVKLHNTSVDFENRLQYVAKHFLQKRTRHLPVIVKISNDVSIDALPNILNILFKYKFDGINIGNTSTNYEDAIKYIAKDDVSLFKYFTKNFGGGVSGKYLQSNSLFLCTEAVKYKNTQNLDYEFHVIRTGGVASYEDVLLSKQYGISLNQWYTGFFSNYILHGNDVYNNIFLSIP